MEELRSYLLLINLNSRKEYRIKQLIKNIRDDIDRSPAALWQDADHVGIALQSTLMPTDLLARATKGLESDISNAMALELCGLYAVMDRDSKEALTWLSTHVRPRWGF